MDWISVIVLGGTSLTVDLINLYDNNQFTIESCQIFPLLNEVTCKNFQGWGRWGGSMWLQLLENYKWVWKISTVNFISLDRLLGQIHLRWNLYFKRSQNQILVNNSNNSLDVPFSKKLISVNDCFEIIFLK